MKRHEGWQWKRVFGGMQCEIVNKQDVDHFDEDTNISCDKSLISTETSTSNSKVLENLYYSTKIESQAETVDIVEQTQFTCDKCNKAFPTEKRLKKHSSNAHLTGKFPCPLCNKLFTRRDQCKDHIYSHSDKKIFPCSYENCEKIFQQLSNLKQHERVHTGVYRKNCPICSENVVQLSKHLDSHFKTKLFPCDSCDKTFTRRCYLIEHQMLHFGEIGFICSDCFVEFKSSNALYKHKRSKHNSEIYTCEIPECQREFNRKDNMVSHMKRRHKLLIETVSI